MAIQHVTIKPEHIKKTGALDQGERRSDKKEDMFSLLLSLSMNIANQGVKDTGLADKKIEKKPVAEAVDKKEGSDEDKTIILRQAQDDKHGVMVNLSNHDGQSLETSGEPVMNEAFTKDNENPPLFPSGGMDNANPPLFSRGGMGGSFSEKELGVESDFKQTISPIKTFGDDRNVFPGEPVMIEAFTKGNENWNILRQAQDDKLGCHGEPVEPFYGVRRFSDEGHSIMETEFKLNADTFPDSIVNPQIENLDNNKLINDNGMLVTAVKGTPVNTEGNNISSQSVYRYADQGNLVQYMSQQIIHASHVGTHTAKISLRPAELGELRLDISVADKNVKALIVVENEEIKKMVESGFNSLRDELKNQGLNVEQFSVEIQKDDFMDNFKSMYERHEKGSKKRADIIPDIIPGNTEHPVIMPLSWIKGGLSLFA